MAMRDVVGSATALIDMQITADLAALGWTAPLTTALGSSADWLMNAPPAIVWVPTRDRFDLTPPSVRPVATATQQAPSVKTCWMGFEARLWAVYTNLPAAGFLVNRPAAEDWSAVEILRDQLIVALQKKVAGFYELGEGQWQGVSGAKQGAEELLLGRSYSLPVWIARPVCDLVSITQAQILTGVPMTRQLVTPQGTTTDSP